MTDANQGGAAVAHRAVVRRVTNAIILAALGLILGGLLFQVSSIAFDYMKVRGFPLYGSASSLPRFSAVVQLIDREMEPNATRIRELLRDRATIDLDIAARKEDAEITLSQAKTFLRPIAAVELNFTAIDEKFQQLCAPAENAAAAVQTAELAPTPPVGADAATPGAAQTAKTEAAKPAPPVLALTPAQRALMGPACHIADEPYSVAAPRGIRHRMICAQQALQTALRRKTAVTNYDFDDAKYMSDALRVTYPAFSAEQVVDAAKIAEIYNTTVNGPAGTCPCCGAAAVTDGKAASAPADPKAADGERVGVGEVGRVGAHGQELEARHDDHQHQHGGAAAGEHRFHGVAVGVLDRRGEPIEVAGERAQQAEDEGQPQVHHRQRPAQRPVP